MSSLASLSLCVPGLLLCYSHHIIAYRFSAPSPRGYSGHDDGGEATAGRKLRSLLELQVRSTIITLYLSLIRSELTFLFSSPSI